MAKRVSVCYESSWLQPSLDRKYQQWSHFSTLPKLPLPPLRQTLLRFLAVAKPLTTAKEFDQVVKVVEQFGEPNGSGEKLHAILEKRAQNTSNWLSDWWLDKAYLEQRCCLPINVSPGLAMPLQNFNGVKGQIEYASKLIVALLHYKALIDRKALPVDNANNQPLDMSQYELLFGTCRIPCEKKDTLRYGVKEDTRHNHIVVARNNQFFAVPVYSKDWQPLSERQIAQQLNSVVQEAGVSVPVSEAVGLMTTEDRDIWGSVYKSMKGNFANSDTFEAIETSIFLLALDGPHEKASSRLSALGSQLLHGGGSTANAGNRWYDKCLQFIVGVDGGCGLTYEHSPAEGPPVAAMQDFSIDYIAKGKLLKDADAGFDAPKKLQFTLSKSDREHIQAAAKKFDKFVADTEMHVFVFEKFGKNFPKSEKISPDSFVQLGLQLAFHKIHGECPATYETGTLRRFKLGRTDTIRLPSVGSRQFVEAMRDSKVSSKDRAALLRQAVQEHKDYSAAACSGNGMDRHLLGLKLTAEENGFDIPPLLRSPIYEKMVHYKLSTSQVTSKHESCMMFGPMYSDCYGVCYNPQETKIFVSVSAFNSCPTTSAVKFGKLLSESFLEMHQTLLDAVKSKL